MKRYNITVLNQKLNLNITLSINSNKFILDSLDEFNIKLPYSCKLGSCSNCVCKLIKGSIKHFNQTFLSNKELKKKFILPCVAYPTSNIIMLTHMEDKLYE
jgi:ferredoxin